jgi:hypothetical protein
MKPSLWLVAVALGIATATPLALADSTSTANGGAGGAGGSAAGGTATGGAATGGTASSGVSSASGGQGGTAAGGASYSSGGNVGSVSTGGSSAQTGDVTVNYNVPATAMGKSGLGVGVDPTTGHVMTDNTVNYQGSYKIKNTPDVNVGGPASGPCNGFSGGLGVSMAGFSVGANASTVDEGCSARETARVAAMVGRMDIANAILDNLPIVQAAMKAQAAREALSMSPKSPETPATTAPAQWSPAVPVQTQAQREAALKEQQRLAQEALQRQATMAKLNDTLKFTDATTQGSEKTPQEKMAEETNKKLAAKAEGANEPRANGNPVPSGTQQANKSDGQAITTPLPVQPMIKSETIAQAADGKIAPDSPTTNTLMGPVQTAKTEAARAADKRSPSAATVEERVRAVKAALNLQ